MGRMIGLAVIVGGVVLAVMVGQRMSSDAMAVAVGVMFGVAASIPASLLIVAATRGRRPEYGRAADPPPVQTPQIYIVNPGTQGGQKAAAPWLQAGLPAPTDFFPGQPPRRFKVVGDDEQWLEQDEQGFH